MGGISATILIGSEANNGSDIDPEAMMFLQEGSNPSWVFMHLPGLLQGPQTVLSFFWKTLKPQTIMKDGLLMLATYVVRDPAILDILKKALGLKEIGTEDILGRIDRLNSRAVLEDLYAALHKCNFSGYRMMVSFLHAQDNHGSRLNQLNEFKGLKDKIIPLVPAESIIQEPKK